MIDALRLMAAKRTPTPEPGVGAQVASDIKDTVSVAANHAGDLLDRLPQFLSRLLMSCAVIIAGIILLKVGKFIIAKCIRGRAGKKDSAHRADTSRSVISSIFSYIMFFIMAAVILRLFGVDVTSILAAAGVVGVAIAFGAQTLVKDLLSGLFIWGEGKITVGDLVSINDLTGTVESISIRTTSIRNYNGNVYTIPNGDIRTVTNMSRSFKRAIVSVPCPYDADQEELVRMIKEEMEIAAKEIDGVEDVPDVMSIVSFDPRGVMLQVAVACPVGEHWRVERDIRTRIKARFDREGIVIPHYTFPGQNT